MLIGDAEMLGARAALLGLPFAVPLWQGRAGSTAAVTVLPLALARPIVVGRLDSANAPYVVKTLERALGGCLGGEFDAMVTAPVHKGIINDAGIPFTGHTEFLAKHSGVNKVVMMLTDGTLRVALATTHCALTEVSKQITETHLCDVLRILYTGLQQRFAIRRPRILVCALNPHGGESGYLGREEIEVIEPALAALRREGLQLRGPVPADTAFTPAQLAETDAVLAMYHDQGLPVLKARGFGRAVNITLGLPFVRTSVDHGTALAIAGSGDADPASLRAAVDMAYALVSR